MSKFNENLKSWRLVKRLTQADLAAQSGMSRPNLVALEQGRRDCTLTTLYRLARSLNISPGTLLENKPPQQRRSPLNRHQIDLVAKELLALSPGHPLPSELTSLRDSVGYEVGPLLRVADLSKRFHRPRQNRYTQPEIEKVSNRVRKLLSYKLGDSL